MSAPTASPRPWGGPDRAGGRLPGRLHQPRRDHARPRRLRHDRRRARRRHRRRGLRDLHRRGRRVQRGPADRARCPQAAPGELRGDAGDVGLRRGRADAPLGGVRADPRCPHPLPVELRRRPRYRLSSEKTRRWNTRSSPPSPTRPTRLGSRSSAFRTGRARPRRSSSRWPTPTATSTRSSRTSRSTDGATPRCRSRSAPRTCAPPRQRSSP